MTTKPPRRVPEEKAATPADISAAIEALTTAQWARLKRYSDNRIRKLGPKADLKSGDDLLSIALISLLDGTRRWDQAKVDFVRFMILAMKSISSNWARGYKPEETLALEVDIRKENAEGEIFGLLDNVADDGPGPQQQVLDEEKRRSDGQILDEVEALFKDDQDAEMVLTSWAEGYDPPGVRELWGLSQKDYDTIVRRIRRKLDRAGLTAKGRSNV